MLKKQSRLGELFLLIKGHNAKIKRQQNRIIPFFSGYQIDLMLGLFEFKLFGYFNTANNSLGTESKTAFMKLKSLKWLSKLKHVNRKYPLLRPFRWLIS